MRYDRTKRVPKRRLTRLESVMLANVGGGAGAWLNHVTTEPNRGAWRLSVREGLPKTSGAAFEVDRMALRGDFLRGAKRVIGASREE